MESVLAAAVTGVLTLLGVLVSNTKSRAVMELKIDALAEKVELCQDFGHKMPLPF